VGESGDDRNAFLSRIGTFFLLIGMSLMVLFVASDIAKTTYFRYFFLGAIALLVGFVFKRMTFIPSKPSNRFEGIRKYQQKRREAAKKREEAKKAKQAKK
jgi:hypothetical protein